MKLLINGSNLRGGGGVQVALSFILETRKFPENDYYVLASDKLYEQLKKEKFSTNYTIFSLYMLQSNPIKKIITIFKIKQLEKKINPNVVFTIFGPSYWTPRSPHLTGFALGHLIYPESPYFDIIHRKELLYWKIISILKKYFLKKNSSYYHVETDDTRIRLTKYLLCNPKNIFVVSNTYNPFFDNFEISAKKLLPLAQKNEFRLLLLSAYYSHKNFEIINRVIDLLSTNKNINIKFVVTIDKKMYTKIFGSNNKYVINIGHISADLCPQLYSECDVMFLPSLIECFSANYPEAMKMRKPILTSDLPFARDICEDSAVYFDPFNAKDLVDKIYLLVDNKELNNYLIERGVERLKRFDNSANRAKKYLQICNNISNK